MDPMLFVTFSAGLGVGIAVAVVSVRRAELAWSHYATRLLDREADAGNAPFAISSDPDANDRRARELFGRASRYGHAARRGADALTYHAVRGGAGREFVA